ncbi:MAG TPA: sulfotransferase domain-containing protein [Xanthobacteraceae bacterium]|nr:sulfotransferase domain-containing protein [Xanthobacteraceae bacterium]
MNMQAADQADSKEDMPTCVVGLYSFPRSGNTWLRQIVASALDIPANMLQRFVTDMAYGQIVTHPIVYEDKEFYFYKSHHKQLVTEHRGQTIRTDKIVYIYRHPLDVFLSYLNFASKNVNSKVGEVLQFQIDSVEKLSKEELGALFSVFMSYGTITPQNRAYGGYFEHVDNAFALRESGADIHIMRYEDLLNNFVPTAGKMFEFLGIPVADIQAIHGEADKRTAQDGKFFWKRQSKVHEEFLTKDQIAAFNSTFRDKLVALGYPPE